MRSGTAFALSLGIAIGISAPARAQTTIDGGFRLGMDVPFHDQAVTASTYGIFARIGGTAFAFEPGVNWLGGGDRIDITSLGLNGISRGGILPWIYWTGGLGWSWVDREPEPDQDGAFSYNVGLGAEIPLGPVRIDGSGRFLLINPAGDGHYEHLLLTVGFMVRMR